MHRNNPVTYGLYVTDFNKNILAKHDFFFFTFFKYGQTNKIPSILLILWN